jgi:hypothetical protein
MSWLVSSLHSDLLFGQMTYELVSQFTSQWSLTGHMTYELVLKIFPVQYNVIAGVKVHGSYQDGG